MVMKQMVLFIVLMGLCFAYGQTTVSPNPLAAMPSAPGSTVDSIKAMKNNSWLNLGMPAPDPVWGRAYGRAWGGKGLILSPELRAGFYTGEGFHAGTRSTPYGTFGLDDYWVYDINGHRWICIYPGTNIRGFNDSVAAGALRVDSLGRGVDRDGQPIPAHQLIHAWGFLSYDTDLKKFSFLGGGGFYEYFFPGWSSCSAGVNVLLGQGLNKAGTNFAPWSYNTLTGKFERETAANARPGVGSYSQYIYIGGMKEFFNGGAEGVAFFNPSTNSWRKVANPGTGPSGYDFGACYDSKRERVYMGQTGNNYFYFDLATEKWNKISNPKNYTFNFSANYASVTFDSINDVVIIFDFATSKKLYLFDPNNNVWLDEYPLPSGFSYTNGTMYDAELGVHIVCSGGDSRDDNKIWIYKLRDKAEIEKEKELTSVDLSAGLSSIEQYLSVQLKILQTYQTRPSDTAPSFLGASVFSLNPDKATVTPAGLLTAHDSGVARIVLIKNELKDTLVLNVVQSTATTDSLVVKPAALGLFAGDSFPLICTGYFHQGSQTFTRILDTVALWQSADTSVVTVNKGLLIGKKAGGSLNVTVSYDGKSTVATITVWPKLSFVKRINFQVSSTPWKFGWLADNGATYNATRGYGWLNGAGSARDDRAGTNFLLKSFVEGAAGARYKMNLPSGRYIIKTGMGDADYGKNSYYWMMYGTDTINSKNPGLVNGINVDTITVSGDTGAVFAVKGPLNYIVVISDEEVDINAVADDGGLVVNETIGSSGIEIESAIENYAFSVEPNPSNPVTRIRLPKGLIAGKYTLDVLDINGKIVYSLTNAIVNGEVLFHGADLASGIYVIRLRTLDQNRSIRLSLIR